MPWKQSWQQVGREVERIKPADISFVFPFEPVAVGQKRHHFLPPNNGARYLRRFQQILIGFCKGRGYHMFHHTAGRLETKQSESVVPSTFQVASLDNVLQLPCSSHPITS
jgi:hypothetical protein